MTNEETCRAEFEKRMRQCGWETLVRYRDGYMTQAIDIAWIQWQACWQAAQAHSSKTVQDVWDSFDVSSDREHPDSQLPGYSKGAARAFDLAVKAIGGEAQAHDPVRRELAEALQDLIQQLTAEIDGKLLIEHLPASWNTSFAAQAVLKGNQALARHDSASRPSSPVAQAEAVWRGSMTRLTDNALAELGRKGQEEMGRVEG
jgi:hypothetical protein